MTPKKFLHSIKDACKGIRYVFVHEQNFRIQCILAIFVFLAGVMLNLVRWEMIVVSLLVIIVLVLELINSAVEKFTDILKPRLSGHVEIVKDIMAGVVLTASIGAFIIAIYIFVPHILDLV